MRKRLPNIIKYATRKLRREQTKAEAILWEELKSRKFGGEKFLRQHPIVFEYNGKRRFIVADFYCHQAKLVIEIDGGIHEKQKDCDKMRDKMVELLGLKVLRIKNEYIQRDVLGVLRLIENHA